jgi:Tfp pilus assembly protein PilO
MSPKNRTWLLALAVACVGVLALGWFVGIGPKLTEIAGLRAQVSQTDATNKQYQAQIDQMIKDAAMSAEVTAQLEELGRKLPETANYPAFLAQITSAASQSNTKITGVTWTVPSVLTVDAEAGAANQDANSGDATTGDTGNTGAVPVGGVVGIPVTVQVQGSYDEVRSFFAHVQTIDRVFTVTQYNWSQFTSTSYRVDITGLIFVVVSGKTNLVPTSAPVPPAPTETPTPTPTESGTPTSTDTPSPTDTSTTSP